MRDEKKTKKELIQELRACRRRLALLEKVEADCARLETRLERGERRFQSVIDNINVGLYRNTAGPKGRFIEVNRALINMFGYASKDEVLKLNVSELYLHPEDRRKFSRKLKERGHVRDEKVTLKKRDGTPIDCSVSAVSVRDGSGEIRFFDGVIEDVTERQKAVRALRESEEKFRNIVESSPMGMHLYELQPDDRLVFIGANPAADRILQVDNSQFIGRSIEEAFPPLAETEIPQRYREAAAGGKFWKTDQATYEDDAIKGAFEVYAFQTSPGRMVAMFLDITQRKQAEEALKESKERYQSLFDRSLYGVYIHDFQGRFLDANQAALEMLGYGREDIVGLNFTDLLDENQLKAALDGITEILTSDRQGKPSVFRLKTKSGSAKWVETEATLIFKREEPFAIQGIARDITEQKMAEEALRESEEQYRAIFDSFQDVYYRTDRDGLVTLISPSVKTQAGYDPEDVIGHPVTDFYADPDERQIFTENLKMNGIVNDYELQLLAKDGRIIRVSATSKLVTGVDGRPVGVEGVLRDITDRKHAEENLKASLKEKEVLLQEIHHRVKNNMQIISSLLNIQSRKLKDRKIVELFQESRSRIRAMALIHEKLYQSHDLANVNLAEYIESLSLHLFHMYSVDSNSVKLGMEVQDVYLDINTAIPIGLVINELVSNAVKHAFSNGANGKIVVRLSAGSNGDRCLQVTDNGKGLPEGFDIGKPETLGMQLICDLVAQINGSIQVETHGGASFRVAF